MSLNTARAFANARRVDRGVQPPLRERSFRSMVRRHGSAGPGAVRAASIALTCLAVLAIAGGCGGSNSASDSAKGRRIGVGMSFVPASRRLIASCHAAARMIGYPVPCPTKVPKGLIGYTGKPRCSLSIIGPAEPCPNTAFAWRGWVVGSSTTATEHLVITASPRRLDNYAKVVNGPGWYPQARVQLIAWVTIHGWRMRAVFAPMATNDGSAFAQHVVLIWTVGRHTPTLLGSTT